MRKALTVRHAISDIVSNLWLLSCNFMIKSLRLTLCLLTSIWLQPAWGAEEATYKECIEEPVFQGRVCTVQANRAAEIGVILIHGLGGSTDDWNNTLPVLAANFHVITFDLPGFGKSDKGSQNYSPTRYARLVQYLADRYLQHKPYHVVDTRWGVPSRCVMLHGIHCDSGDWLWLMPPEYCIPR